MNAPALPLVRCIVEVDGDGRPTLWFQPFEEPGQDVPLGLLVFGLEGATLREAGAIAQAINTSGARLSTAMH
jgi:hypothetical protein